MKFAVIGTGISGMLAAYLLSRRHEVVVFEAEDYAGGHTHTIDVSVNGTNYPVDTGFIVFNEKTYPNFVKLMKMLGVSWKPTKMSFSVQCLETGLEYSPSSLNSLFAQRINLLRPSFYRMLLDTFRFRLESLELLKKDDYQLTLGEYLNGKGYSKGFINHFIIPMGEAIWSADPAKFNDFPAHYFVQFFHNHGILKLRNQPEWLVIEGGSRTYVEPLTRPYADNLRLQCPVLSVMRYADRVEIKTKGEQIEHFDQVVIAAHSDQALAMLSDPSEAEREILGGIPYQDNLAVLHQDASLMPRSKAAWASWNYFIPRQGTGYVSLTYNMNILQGLGSPVEFCVTLNPTRTIDPAQTVCRMNYHHPVYTSRGTLMQKRHNEINGVNRTYFCGAYWGYGFHEDGVNSALAVCRHFGEAL